METAEVSSSACRAITGSIRGRTSILVCVTGALLAAATSNVHVAEVVMAHRKHATTCSVVIAIVGMAVGCDERAPTSPAVSLPHAVAATNAVLPAFPGADQFVATVTNPYFPLIVGTTFTYQTETADGLETNTVQVTDQKKKILGVRVNVVHDQVFLDGVLREDTFDWYAQDTQGNVWYLGEQSCEIVNNQCVSTAGSWEAGVDGAQPGIIMFADPAAQKGITYRQEYFAGEAEDVAKVVGTNASATVPYGSFSNCIETVDWSLLENSSKEHKVYCPGTGLVLEVANGERSELVTITP